MSLHKENAAPLQAELDWLARLIEARVGRHFAPPSQPPEPPLDLDALPPPAPVGEGAYARFVREHEWSPRERVVLALGLAPHLRPQLLDVFLARNEALERPMTEFGGSVGMHGGFTPTLETAFFLLAGDDLAQRLAAMDLLDASHPLLRRGFLLLEPQPGADTFASRRLLLSQALVDRLTLGQPRKPTFGPGFPAALLTTALDWSDLVLDAAILEQLAEIRTWMESSEVLLGSWGLAKRLGRGFRCLFHGPPGTGKTTTAALLGKLVDRDVYRVDLANVVSKYIGETEKNLENVFRHAEQQHCVLFFDEADALFGKRTGVSSAHDRYANQETAYLLQRLEEFSGVVILASNLKANLDDAFLRRFHSVIHFPVPSRAERLRLWRDSFSSASKLENAIDLEELAERYELAGGSILNVVRHSSLRALQRRSNEILLADVREGIRREYQKEGKPL